MGLALVLGFLKDHIAAIALSIALAVGVWAVEHHGYNRAVAVWKPKYELILAQKEEAQKRATAFVLQLTEANAKIDTLTRAALKKVENDFKDIHAKIAAAAGGHGIRVPAGLFNALELAGQTANAARPDGGGAGGAATAAVVAEGAGAEEEIDPQALGQWAEAYDRCVVLWKSVRDKYNAARDGTIRLEGAAPAAAAAP